MFFIKSLRIGLKEEKTKMILIGTGGNLASIYGSVYQTVEKAFELLAERGVNVDLVSGWYQTAPVPVSDQPWYKNCVFSVKTNKNPAELMTTLLEVENLLGRVRTVKNAARVLDLDILAYDDMIIHQVPELILPHPRMHQRAFVLYPLREIAPDWVHPVFKQSVDELIADLPSGQEIIKE